MMIENLISCSFGSLIFFSVIQNIKNASIVALPSIPDENDSFLITTGIYMKQLPELKALGIIDGVGFSGVLWDLPTQSNDMFIYRVKLYNNIVSITNSNKNVNPQFNAYTLTKLGLELKNILELDINMDYFDIVFCKLKKMGYEVIISKEEK